jgi:hypothetical protein
MMKKIIFLVEHYVDPWTSNVHDLFKVCIEGDIVVYSKDYGYSSKNMIDYIRDFLKDFDVQAMMSNTYTIDMSNTNSTYSISNPPDRMYVTDDTI